MTGRQPVETIPGSQPGKSWEATEQPRPIHQTGRVDRQHIPSRWLDRRPRGRFRCWSLSEARQDRVAERRRGWAVYNRRDPRLWPAQHNTRRHRRHGTHGICLLPWHPPIARWRDLGTRYRQRHKLRCRSLGTWRGREASRSPYKSAGSIRHLRCQRSRILTIKGRKAAPDILPGRLFYYTRTTHFLML